MVGIWSEAQSYKEDQWRYHSLEHDCDELIKLITMYESYGLAPEDEADSLPNGELCTGGIGVDANDHDNRQRMMLEAIANMELLW